MIMSDDLDISGGYPSRHPHLRESPRIRDNKEKLWTSVLWFTAQVEFARENSSPDGPPVKMSATVRRNRTMVKTQKSKVNGWEAVWPDERSPRDVNHVTQPS